MPSMLILRLLPPRCLRFNINIPENFRTALDTATAPASPSLSLSLSFSLMLASVSRRMMPSAAPEDRHVVVSTSVARHSRSSKLQAAEVRPVATLSVSLSRSRSLSPSTCTPRVSGKTKEGEAEGESDEVVERRGSGPRIGGPKDEEEDEDESEQELDEEDDEACSTRLRMDFESMLARENRPEPVLTPAPMPSRTPTPTPASTLARCPRCSGCSTLGRWAPEPKPSTISGRELAIDEAAIPDTAAEGVVDEVNAEATAEGAEREREAEDEEEEEEEEGAAGEDCRRWDRSAPACLNLMTP